MSDEESRIREALAAGKPQPGELHDAAIRRAMRDTAANLAASATPAPRRRTFLPAGLAAGLLLLVGGGIFLRSMPRQNDVMRGADMPASALLPAANAELAQPPAEFRWPAQAGATSYLVTLRDEAGAVLWRSEPGTAAALTLPADVRARLVPGHSYLWSVTVSGLVDANELGPYAFRVR